MLLGPSSVGVDVGCPCARAARGASNEMPAAIENAPKIFAIASRAPGRLYHRFRPAARATAATVGGGLRPDRGASR